MFDRIVLGPTFLAQATTPPTRPAGVEATGGGTPAPTPTPVVNTGGNAGTVGGAGATTGTTATTSQPGSPAEPGKANAPGGVWGTVAQLAPIILMFVVLYFIMFRGQRKEEKRRKGLIAELKKGDRVMTIGGMMARVVSIDGDEVVLKIDESANVKATYRKSAIQEVLVADEKKS